MNRFLLLWASLLLLAQVALAQPAGMGIRSERGLPFRLRLDGNRIGGRHGLTQVRFDRLAPGLHWAEFQVPANGGVLNYRTRVELLPGREARFVLVTRRGYPPVLQRVDDVPLPGWAGYGRGRGLPPRFEYGYQCQPTPFSGPASWPLPGGSRDDWYDRDADYDEPNGYGQPPAGGYAGSGGYGGNNNDGYYPGGSNGYRHELTAQETEQLIRAVRARSFDDQKIILAKQAIAETSIRSEDLRRLLAVVDFDRGRLELAKFAFARVADRQNFYRIYDVFAFDSSVREMQQYIEQNRGA